MSFYGLEMQNSYNFIFIKGLYELPDNAKLLFYFFNHIHYAQCKQSICQWIFYLQP
jgi:hypothetical protein